VTGWFPLEAAPLALPAAVLVTGTAIVTESLPASDLRHLNTL
jgi:hypothetical protein